MLIPACHNSQRCADLSGRRHTAAHSPVCSLIGESGEVNMSKVSYPTGKSKSATRKAGGKKLLALTKQTGNRLPPPLPGTGVLGMARWPQLARTRWWSKPLTAKGTLAKRPPASTSSPQTCQITRP